MTSPAYDLSDERLTVQQFLAEGHSPGVPVDGNAERASDSELGLVSLLSARSFERVERLEFCVSELLEGGKNVTE